MFLRKFPALALALALVLVPAFRADAAAGGEITGTVTDPKGALVAGARVTATDAAGKITAAATDGEGRFKLSGLAPGAYTLVVVSDGFAEARRDRVVVEEGRAARVDFQLQVALDAGSVTVSAGGKPGRGDATYRQLRDAAKDPESFKTYATVNNLVLRRDAATFTLRSGELYFIAPVEGRVAGAVFFGEGELALTPPVEHERHSLSIFTGGPSLTEQFTKLVLRFTDKTFDEIKASPNARLSTGGPQAERARNLYKENQTLLRKDLRTNYELRALVDLYAPHRPGFFTAFVIGRRFEKLIFQIDPLGIPEVSPEEVMLRSFGMSDGGIWAAFHLSDEYATGRASNNEDHRHYDITRHEINARVEATKITATDRVTLRPLAPGLRVLPFRLFRTLRVRRVSDERGREFEFVQEARDEDADFGVILPEPLEAGKEHTLTVEYAGDDAIVDAGGGNYFLLTPARSTWYPNNYGTQFGDRAAFDVAFRYRKGKTLIGTGTLVEPPVQEGDQEVARWTSGGLELAVSGFNIGLFRRKAVRDETTGYDIEFFANEVPAGPITSSVASMTTSRMGDRVIADAQNSTRLFNAFFGKLPYARVAMTQQPSGSFGQAWPTLIYMPYTAFLDPTQRYLAGGIRSATGDFYKYVGPHEVAHQWWGHTVGWTSYRDQWMSEGFAQFSTSLFVQAVYGDDRFREFWEDEREQIVSGGPMTRDRRPYKVGPVTQGFRLNSGKTGASYQFLVYPKGGFILHMLRMLMYEPRKGRDERFVAMMKDFVATHYNKDVSTEDFRRIVQKHITPEMCPDGSGRIDWFFDQWVYGTEMPSYRLEYRISGNTISGTLTQSGVSDKFVMRVPVYVDYGKGWVRLGVVNIGGSRTVEIPAQQLPYPPKRAAVAAMHDVLAAEYENVKK